MLVYYMQLDSDIWSEREDALIKYVSDERKEKISRYHFIRDRKLSLYAALIARMGLNKLSGIPASLLTFKAELNHKPYLVTVPDYDFSISHTRDAILCTITSSGAVGADIEKLNSAPFDIIKNVFHFEEKEYINKTDNLAERSRRFYEVWTRKEAFLKQIGSGLNYDLINCNTLGTDISAFFYTWRQDNYMCSVSASYHIDSNLEDMVVELSENQISIFFLEI